MLADDIACHAKNPYKDKIYPIGVGNDNVNIFENAQVDYTGNDVTVDNFFRVLLGRHETYTPRHQRLHTVDQETNLFLYITGHGGDGFFKFRDEEDFTTKDLRGVFEQLQVMKRFHSVLYVSDTCQAFTTAPNTEKENSESRLGVLKNVYSVASSLKSENSYAHHSDGDIGHSVMDRYVYNFVTFMGGFGSLARGLWKEMDRISVKAAMVTSMYSRSNNGVSKLGANIGWSDLGCDRSMDTVPLSDFLVMKNGVSRSYGVRNRDEARKNSQKAAGEDVGSSKDGGVILLEDAVDF
jgi:phosphatidylinositol glycan class K